MKLIIDIDEEDYLECAKRVKEIKEKGYMIENSKYKIIIANGTPLRKELKKIRTKIDALPTMSCNNVGCSYMWAKDYKIDVLNILDKSMEKNK